VLRIGIDLGGCITKYPIVFKRLLAALGWSSNSAAVYVVTDQHDEAKVRAQLTLNGIYPPAGHVLISDYATFGEECKAVVCNLHNLDVLIDDHGGYVAVVGHPLVRLLVMPDPTLPYLDSSWVTDGKEGDFGRRSRRNPSESKSPR
jgi:hypothetical protein